MNKKYAVINILPIKQQYLCVQCTAFCFTNYTAIQHSL